jgi:hypothetical protein
MSDYAHGAAWWDRRGIHYFRVGSDRCVKCGTPRAQADVEDADTIRSLMLEQQRADLEAADQYPDTEQDIRSHREEY